MDGLSHTLSTPNTNKTQCQLSLPRALAHGLLGLRDGADDLVSLSLGHLQRHPFNRQRELALVQV